METEVALSPPKSATQLLLVDDDEDDYLIIRSLVAKISNPHFELQWVKDLGEASAIISADNHDIYLIDYWLGAQTGLDLLKNFNLIQRKQPFIILTGSNDEEIEHRAMKLGVADYLIKGSFNDELLARVLRYSLQRKQMENDRLQHLIELNQIKDEFIAVASHQLRTPATAVKQYIGMLMQGYAGKITADQRKMLDNAYESNERQLKIINSLLQAARANAGKVTLYKSSIDLLKLIQSVVQDQTDALATKNQRVEIISEPEKPATLITADPETLRMVIDNLLDNAIKYSSNNQLITIGVSRTAKAIAVSVSDRGVGISKVDQAKLFEKFSRLDGAMPSAGSGLGLYWVKYLVDLHGGSIGVKSTKGKGSTFRFSLPIND